MAKYHEVGRFCDKKDEDIDWDSALYHEVHAADLGELEAILTLAKLYLGQERDVLINCVIDVCTCVYDTCTFVSVMEKQFKNNILHLYMVASSINVLNSINYHYPV